MSELVTYQPPTTALTIGADQERFTDQQVAVLRHLGVESASEGDLAVFFHQVKRTGLDPFVRQIYMIGRTQNEKDARGNWVKTVKQTIQTGIDGYRLIARRAADRRHETYGMEPVQWAHRDGGWRELWTKDWGHPLAARVTVVRNGQNFTATALFDEYVQTKRDGTPTQMWEQRPAGQLAKCAEALALRMAFPQDLAGIYTDAEIDQAQPDEAPAVADEPPKPRTVARARKAPEPPPEPEEPPLDDDPIQEFAPKPGEPPADPITEKQMRALQTALGKAGARTPQQRHDVVASIIGRPIDSAKELTKAEASFVLDRLSDEGDDAPPAEPTLDDGWQPAAKPGGGAS